MYDIYSKGGCSYCVKAKNLLTQKNIAFNEYVMGTHITFEQIREKFPTAMTFPIIVEQTTGQYIGGYMQLESKLRLNEIEHEGQNDNLLKG